MATPKLVNSNVTFGFNSGRATPKAEYALGTQVQSGATIYVYATSSAARAEDAVFTLDANFAAGTGTGYSADKAVGAGEYFWAKKA